MKSKLYTKMRERERERGGRREGGRGWRRTQGREVEKRT